MAPGAPYGELKIGFMVWCNEVLGFPRGVAGLVVTGMGRNVKARGVAERFSMCNLEL